MTAVSAVGHTHTFAANDTSSSSYTVQYGDTLSGIAQRFGVSLSALEAANPQITNPNLIYPGERLSIPGGGSVTPTPPPGHGGPASSLSISENGVKMMRVSRATAQRPIPTPEPAVRHGPSAMGTPVASCLARRLHGHRPKRI